MSDLTDWIKNELYPTLYERIDQVFTEHDFKRGRKGWKSKTYLNGSPHRDRSDKTKINEGAPGYIFEEGGEGKGLVDYVMSRDGLDFIEAVRHLAGKAGLQVPQNGTFDSEAYAKRSRQISILEDANSYFVWCLHNAEGAEEARTYLRGRGYTDEDIKDMGLGYIPSQAQARTYLKEKKGYTPEAIKEALQIDTITGIGSTHKITIPYRSGGKLHGFAFRAHGSAEPKYLNTSGLDRSNRFFNHIGRSKELIIVEGYLDTLIADAKGAGNVVALGGTDIHQAQIEHAISRGVETFTLCLDNDPGGRSGTLRAIDKLLEAGAGRIYVMVYSVNTALKDPDEVIIKEGIAAFEQMHRERVPYWAYWLQTIGDKYDQIQTTESRALTYAELDELKTDLIRYGSRIEDPTDRDTYLHQILTDTGLQAYGVTRESLDIITAKLRTEKAEEERKDGLKKLLREAGDKLGKGDTTGVLELLDNKSKQLKIKTGADLIPPFRSYADHLQNIATIPAALKTGYGSLDKFIGFTPGAITLIAGRPSHGKTTFMFNLLLEMSELHQDKRFYFFSYEEPVGNIIVKLLNRLTATDLSGLYGSVPELPKQTNYEFLKAYIRTGRTDISAIEAGKKKLQDLIDSHRIRIIGENYSVEELQGLIAYLNEKEKIGGVFIDYIQRMNTERRTQDKRTEIAHISDQVLQIAKSTGLPIILGAQLNRATTTGDTKGKGKNPALENLKEAGNLEEDANTVLSVFNESREKEETADGESYSSLREVNLEIRALKNREGEVNRSAKLVFDKWTGVIKEGEVTDKW